MKLEVLRHDDLDAALVLSTAEAWNQTAADWRRMIELEPSGCFAARDEDRLVGTVTTTTYGRDLAWIGMMIVHPEFRRRGLGAGMMRVALDHLHGLGIATVKLDATPAGRPLYESLGFATETEMERWQGIAHAGGGSEGRPFASAFDSGDAARRGAMALDRSAYGVDRSRLLERLIAEGLGQPLVSAASAGTVEGLALARRGRTASYLGPIVATNATAAEWLLDGLLARCAGDEVCLDLHRGGWLEPGTLAARGLTKRRGLSRMRHGAPGEAGTSRSICASAGPEFG